MDQRSQSGKAHPRRDHAVDPEAQASQLYGIEPSDPRVLLATAVALTAIAALASLLPARRATRVDVMRILSAE